MKNKKKYIKRLQKAQNRLANAKEDYMNAHIYHKGVDTEELLNLIKHAGEIFGKALGEISRTIRFHKEYEMSPHDEIGDLMTMEDFKGCVEGGGFIDYDGFGYYATEKEQSNIVIYPSDIKNNKVREEFSHVKWYNR